MLNPEIITAYLSKQRPSYEFLKDCTSSELDAALAEYLPDLSHLKLWRHQKVALLLLAELKRFMLFMDMGSGKTLTTLALIKGLKDGKRSDSAQTLALATDCVRPRRLWGGNPPRAIVFVPYVTSVMTWVDECNKHTPGLICIPLVSDTQTNLADLGRPGDLYVICYQSAVAMLSKRDAGKWRLDVDQIRRVFCDFNVLVCDEIHKCKSVGSLTYRMCRIISAQCKYSFGLTGTPFGRDLQDLWAQFFIIDKGETLGPTLGFYREVFFRQKRNHWGGYEYTFRKKLLPDLKRIIRSKSIHYSIEDLMDLPPKTYVTKGIRCPDAAKGFAEEAITALKKAAMEHDTNLLEGNYLRLRQLSSGFMTVIGETDKIQIEFEDNPKLDALIELIEDMPADCKMVVFYHFVFTNTIISKRLTALEINHARVWGGNPKNLAELKRFTDDPACRLLVINTRSGSSSLNLQFANYCVFFEQPDSPIDRQQAERRVYRPGQQRRVFYYDLLVDGTIDKRVAESNLAGKTLLQELLKGGEL